MNAIKTLRALGPIDMKSIGRDAMLKWIVPVPIFMAVGMRFVLPPLTDILIEQFNFDLSPYYILVASFFTITAPTFAGLITGFLLLDERDEQVLTALLVTPLSLRSYLIYRLVTPVLLGSISTLVAYPLLGLVDLPIVPLLWSIFLSSLMAPLIALVLVAFAPNKVAGMAVSKAVSSFVMPPIVAYFFTGTWTLLFGLIPTYWPLKVFWLAASGQPYSVYAVVGSVYAMLLIVLMSRRFEKIMHQ